MILRILFTAAFACAAPGAAAQDANARNLAAGCAICHGTEGRAVTKDVTTLAGIPPDHLAKQMRDFRDGKRPATVMHQIAKGYSDEQIGQIADYLSTQK